MREGLPQLAALAVAAFVLAVFVPVLSVLPALGLLVALYFYRDPVRQPPRDPRAVLAPADGRVVFVGEAQDDFWGQTMHEIRIFLAVWNVHVQRCPLPGKVVGVRAVPGGKGAAFRSWAHERNERTSVFLEACLDGATVPCTVTQVAGLLARTIACRVAPGQTLSAGEKYGMIKLGSMVVLRLPRSVDLQVCLGDLVTGGLTVVGRAGVERRGQ